MNFMKRVKLAAISGAVLMGTLAMAMPASAATYTYTYTYYTVQNPSNWTWTFYSFKPVQYQWVNWLRWVPVQQHTTTATQKPVTQQPVVQKPVVQQPVAQKPVVQQPVVQKPVVQQPVARKPVTTTPATQSAGLTAEEQQMLNLVNGERAKAGLQPLVADARLTQMARIKSQDMINNNYFSHQSPVYGSPFDMMKQFGITYTTAGENIAGNYSVDAAHQALMASPGHRANILNGQYTRVGIGIVHGGPYGMMFTQDFIG